MWITYLSKEIFLNPFEFKNKSMSFHSLKISNKYPHEHKDCRINAVKCVRVAAIDEHGLSVCTSESINLHVLGCKKGIINLNF